MSAIVADIGDGLINFLKSKNLGQPYTIERAWVTTDYRQYMLETDLISVIIAPSTLVPSAFDLKPRIAFDWDLGIWIDKATEVTTAAVDPLVEFMETIVFLLASNRQIQTPAGRWAQCMKIEGQPSYDQNQMLELRIFRSLILVTYRVTQ